MAWCCAAFEEHLGKTADDGACTDYCYWDSGILNQNAFEGSSLSENSCGTRQNRLQAMALADINFHMKDRVTATIKWPQTEP
jgi:hypothetical protein